MQPSSCFRLGLCGLLFCAGSAVAEQKFYQVVDPDGRIRIIKQADDRAKAPVAAEPAPAPSVTAPAAAESSSPPPLAEKPAAAVAPAKPVTVAPYGGDSYMQSETLEGSNFNPEKKKHFFFISDGAGTRVDEVTQDETVEAPTLAPVAAIERASIPFDSEYQEYNSPEAAARIAPALTQGCMPGDRISKASPLAEGRYESLQIDKRTLHFSGGPGVLQSYKLAGEGIRNLIVRSYAKKEDSPAFSRPLLVFSSQDGCALRVVESYFQLAYPATKTRHAMLEGQITIHADDAYLFVVNPDVVDGHKNTSSHYTLSPYGQISLKWQP